MSDGPVVCRHCGVHIVPCGLHPDCGTWIHSAAGDYLYCRDVKAAPPEPPTEKP
jgi:hypothetical protein